MRMKLILSLLVSMACLSAATNLAAKSDPADGGVYTTKDKEYYLTPEHNLFIRPGLELDVLDVTIPADRQTEVTFRLSNPEDQPLDRTGEETPGPISTSFILSFIPAGEEAYLAYTTRVQTSPITGDSAVQATTDSGGSYTDLGDGTYMYKFATVLPEGYDMDATHSMGMYARRDLTEFDLDRYVENEVYHFVPSGLFAPVPRDIVTTETCNGRCHDPIALHGGSREDVPLCILCHNPYQDIDPDTGNSVDMPLMIHKIHMGANLTNGYNIIGYRQTNHDYSHVEYPAPIAECEDCHTGGIPTEAFPLVADANPVEVCDTSGLGATLVSWGDVPNAEIRMGSPDGNLFARIAGPGSKETSKWVKDGTVFVLVDSATGETMQELNVNATVLGCVGNPPGAFVGLPGAQHTNWLDHPTRKTCGSCHDYINWETGEGHSEFEISQPDDSYCANCHPANQRSEEFDQSVRGAHKSLYKSAQLPGVFVDFVDIADTNPGDTPTVTFTISAKNNRLDPNELNRVRMAITGPNEDFDVYIQENVVGKAVMIPGNMWTYTFETPIPMDAEGSFTLSVEGRDIVEVDMGHEDSPEEDMMEPSLMPFIVTGDSVTARRTVVDDVLCENCHSNLSLHGDNRKNAQYCTTCHQATLTDAVVRPEADFPDQSVHFKYMIHKIHRGAELVNPYIVYGYRSSLHDYSEVEYPGDLRNCEACHVDGSEQLPLQAGLLATTTPQDWWSPTLPVAAACLSCHDDDEAASHAASNTSFFGESCSVCHGEGKEAAVDKVHAN